MKRFASITLLLVILLSACTPTSTVNQTETVPAATLTLPEPQINVTRAPDVKEIAQTYLNHWAAEDYEAMYAMLTQLSQDAFPFEDYQKRYQDTTNTMTLVELTSEVTSSLTNPGDAQVAYTVNFETALVGTISRDMVMNLTMENNTWKIQWEESMIMPELKGGNYLSMDISAPARGNIYDRNGEALVAQSEVVALGITPGGIGDEQHGAL
ncbi:MAG TPA: NTF2-like N-terminal transpeptidase domain-containing protein, partial [Brevefilum sp.]